MKSIQISICLLKKYINFLNLIVEYMKKYTNFNTFTKETYKFSKHYSKIREKIYKFPYNYSINIQMFNKIHEKSYKKVEI